MTRKIKRTKDFEVSVNITNDGFIRPPRDAQRNWILNRALKEFAEDLLRLDTLARRFVRGSDQPPIADRTQGELGDHDIMEDWQIPVMDEMAKQVATPGGDVLEIGFGRGVASDFIQKAGVKSHTIVECNDSVVDRYQAWRSKYPGSDIRLIHAKWQEATDRFELYDGVFFHTYPLNQTEFLENVINSITFAEHFFPTASNHLRPGGAFTYLTNEYDSLSRSHQRLLFKHFGSIRMSLLAELAVPADSRDALWGDTLVVVKAIK